MKNWACKKVVRIRVQWIILLVIIVQTIMKFRLAHQLVQDVHHDFPLIPMETQLSNENKDAITLKYELSSQKGQTRKSMHNELNAFVSTNGNSLGVSNEGFTPKEWSARLIKRAGDVKNTRVAARKTTTKIIGRKARVIYGIMTYDSDTERRRRGLIRKTFLKYFQQTKFGHIHMSKVKDSPLFRISLYLVIPSFSFFELKDYEDFKFC